MADDLVDHFSEAYYFMDTCMKFKYEMEAITASHKKGYEHMQKNANWSQNISFFTKYSVSMLFNHPTNFQPRTLMAFQ
jgi:hypothetical protein